MISFKASIKLALISLISFFVLSCSEQSTDTESESVSLAEHHQWTEQQKTILHSLWLRNLESNNDKSNRLINNSDAIAFGRKLFFDQRFSANNKISCATCHQPDKHFTDGLKTAQGISTTHRNTPTIITANHNHWFFHDGRDDSLWAQALGPLENAAEHGSNRSVYAQLIFNTPSLRRRYQQIFGQMPDITDNKRFPNSAGPVKNSLAKNNRQSMSLDDQKVITTIFVNIGKSLAAYESSLKLDDSRFDRYLAALTANNTPAIQTALKKKEALGLRLFIGKAKCVLCHSGPLFTDNTFHNIGIEKIADKPYDLGRYDGARQVVKSKFNCQGQYNDNKNALCPELEYIRFDEHETLAAFKTPSLRNTSKTAPYMHDGRFNSLNQVIKHYTLASELVIGTRDLLLPVALNEQEISQIEAFLRTLDSPVIQTRINGSGL